MKHGQLNPDYIELKEFTETLPQTFESCGETIYEGRNILKRYSAAGHSVVVKRYRIPVFINRIAYAYFRRSKAQRAYFNALEVIKRGFETPIPIAFLEERRGGILGYSYFVSTESKASNQVRAVNFEPENYIDLLEAMGQFVGYLQNSGICHEDLSPGNILYNVEADGSYYFELCDINRMTFRPINAKAGFRNLQRLLYHRAVIEPFARTYCKVRGLEYDATVNAIEAECHLFWMPKWKKRLYSILPIRR